jgi:hypothetical protein
MASPLELWFEFALRVALAELLRGRLSQRGAQARVVPVEDVEEPARRLPAVGETVEVLRLRDELAARTRRRGERHDDAERRERPPHAAASVLRSTRPGSAPVCSPSRTSTRPFTIVAA